MKGIILAGGAGTRLYPLTQVCCKQLLPVYDKPMVYYPLSVLLLAGIKDILIISTPKDIESFKTLFGNGKNLGINLEYAVQKEPKGIPEAFIIGEKFIGNDKVCLILGDNLFFGEGFIEMLKRASTNKGATLFGYYVSDPERFGVVEFDKDKKAISLEEKPKSPKSNYAITGLYFYDNSVIKVAKSLKPSPRGETEITDLNKVYLKEGNLNLELLGRGFAWLDTGTPKALSEAASFIEIMETRQGLKLGCIEEVAFRNGFIGKDKLKQSALSVKNSEYGKYLLKLVEED